jgi:hypothetical protein
MLPLRTRSTRPRGRGPACSHVALILVPRPALAFARHEHAAAARRRDSPGASTGWRPSDGRCVCWELPETRRANQERGRDGWRATSRSWLAADGSLGSRHVPLAEKDIVLDTADNEGYASSTPWPPGTINMSARSPQCSRRSATDPIPRSAAPTRLPGSSPGLLDSRAHPRSSRRWSLGAWCRIRADAGVPARVYFAGAVRFAQDDRRGRGLTTVSAPLRRSARPRSPLVNHEAPLVRGLRTDVGVEHQWAIATSCGSRDMRL